MKKTDTKNRILDAAQNLMLNEGYHGVTVDRLIAAAGISKGSFFYHFRSKDDLPCALLRRFFEIQSDLIQGAFAKAQSDPSLSAKDRAWQVIDATADQFCTTLDGTPGCVMAAFSYQLMDQIPELREIGQQALRGWQTAFAKLFQIFADNPSGPLTAEELASYFMSVLQGASVIARVENQPQAIHQAAKHFKLYLHQLSSHIDNP